MVNIEGNMPRSAGNRSIKVELEKGKDYFWCQCGHSKSQPFCDGAHAKLPDVPYRPLKFTWNEENIKRGLCSCKKNKTDSGPFCDGSHRKLSLSDFDE